MKNTLLNLTNHYINSPSTRPYSPNQQGKSDFRVFKFDAIKEIERTRIKNLSQSQLIQPCGKEAVLCGHSQPEMFKLHSSRFSSRFPCLFDILKDESPFGA
jgi:hypothetical protein